MVRPRSGWQRRCVSVIALICPNLRNVLELPEIKMRQVAMTEEKAEVEATEKKAEATEKKAEVEDAKPTPAPPSKTPPKKINIQALVVDEEVTSWCGKCKGFTLHRVKTLQPPKPPKSVCLTCKAVHQVRLVEPGKKKKTGNERPNLPAWDVLTADAEAELAPKYMITGNFEYGDFIMHSKYGLGCVVEVLNDERIQVSFEIGVKLMIQNYTR